jgi:2-polyprenyl-3-methyl-5-hydroxy-6-metoxy-1,4-benzoquinol methylase
MKNDFALLFSISDCDLSEMIIEYNKKYNSSEIVNEYEQWIKEESEYNEDEDFDK